MKKLSSSIFLLSFITLAFVGCLKDEGFNNNKYGINDPGASVPAVGFTEGIKVNDGNPIGVDASPTKQDYSFIINYTGSEPPASDIVINLALDNSVVTAYNNNPVHLNDPKLTIAPAGAISIPATVTIPKGQRYTTVNLSITDGTLFDPSKKYAFGARITSVNNAGVQVAQNLSTVLVLISVKNKYDGKYSLVFTNYHPSSNPGYTGATVNVELRTSGPNSVKIYFPAAGGFFNPSILGGSLSYFGAQEPEYTINPVTKKVTVQNSFPGASTFYSMALGFDSHWEPGPPQKIFAKFGYGYGAGGVFDPAGNREWTQVFTYLGPR